MKKNILCRLTVFAICACMTAQSVAAAGSAEVFAEEVQEESESQEVQDTDMPEDHEQEAEGIPEAEEASATDKGNADEPEAEGITDDSDMAETDKIQTGKGDEEVKSKDVSEMTASEPAEIVEETKTSFEDIEKILIEIKYTKSKVNSDSFDGAFYYKGSNMHPVICVYLIEKIEEDEKIDTIPADSIYKNEEGVSFKKEKKLKSGTDYTVSYPASCKALGKYELTVSAAADSQIYEGSRKIPYEVVEKEHEWGKWVTTVKQTVFNEGKQQRTCSICKKKETKIIAKTKATIKFNMKTIPLKVKQTTTKFKVSGLAAKDYVKSYKSSNKKIFTVNKKGKITAKKKGTAKLTVTLASGKKASVKVKVQKGTVKTTKVSVNTSKLVLLKGGKYKLKTTLAPLTAQQKITYSSSNKKVASVSSKGVIQAKKKGTAKITVKSGSKKKRVTVVVQGPVAPNGDSNAFLNVCQKLANTIMTDANWIYCDDSTTKNNFAEARDLHRQTNCSNYVSFCMQEMGTLKPGMTFYSNKRARIVYGGDAAQQAATKKMIENNYKIINVGGKKAIKANLKKGDICLYQGHVNVYAGLNSKGVPLWYDAGRNSTSDGKAKSGYFTNMYRASYYNSLPIYTVFRLKK